MLGAGTDFARQIDEMSALAPEADLDKLDPAVDFRRALDIDSFAFLQFVVGLHDRLGIDVPESDYARVRSLDGCHAYLEARRSALPPRPKQKG